MLANVWRYAEVTMNTQRNAIAVEGGTPPRRKLKQEAQQKNVMGRSAFTVEEFCARNFISKGLFYKLDKAGLAPRYFLVGEKGHRRITAEAEREWQAQREADAIARRAAKNQPAEQSVVEAA
jgi:hypothetical protein